MPGVMEVTEYEPERLRYIRVAIHQVAKCKNGSEHLAWAIIKRAIEEAVTKATTLTVVPSTLHKDSP